MPRGAAADAAGPPRPGLPTAPASTPSRTLPTSTVTNPTTNENRTLRLAPLTGLPPRLPIVTNVPSALPRHSLVGWALEVPGGTPRGPSSRHATATLLLVNGIPLAESAGHPSSSPPCDHQGPADGRWSCDRGRACRAATGPVPGCVRVVKDSRRRPGGWAVGVGAPRIPVPFRGCSNEPRCLPGRASSPRGCRVPAHSPWRRTSWRARATRRPGRPAAPISWST